MTWKALLCIPLVAFSSSFEVSAEYLCWWMKASEEPLPLVQSLDIAPHLALGADLGQNTILGSQSVSLGARSGARFSLLGNMTERFGICGEYLFLPNQQVHKSVRSSGEADSPFLVIPFFDVTLNESSSTNLSFPTMYSGEAVLQIENGMQSAEGAFFGTLYEKSEWKLSSLGGFKWWYLKEALHFNTSSPFISPPYDVVMTEDLFQVKNHFYGALVGLNAQWKRDRFCLEMIGKASFGVLRADLSIAGQLQTNYFDDFGAVQTFSGGYFAQPTNIGQFSNNAFAILPELDLNLRFALRKWIRLQIGYSFLYVDRMLWAGRSMDEKINPTQAVAIEQMVPAILSGDARPQPQFDWSSFWVQGINAGLCFRY